MTILIAAEEENCTVETDDKDQGIHSCDFFFFFFRIYI